MEVNEKVKGNRDAGESLPLQFGEASGEKTEDTAEKNQEKSYPAQERDNLENKSQVLVHEIKIGEDNLYDEHESKERNRKKYMKNEKKGFKVEEITCLPGEKKIIEEKIEIEEVIKIYLDVNSVEENCSATKIIQRKRDDRQSLNMEKVIDERQRRDLTEVKEHVEETEEGSERENLRENLTGGKEMLENRIVVQREELRSTWEEGRELSMKIEGEKERRSRKGCYMKLQLKKVTQIKETWKTN
ncbi:uncharacterized protein LOC123504634 [Portunus trituberculatus]|uniref:uncharacterized protein LOC123504634 n=1 Tax=Portunus trituberculatus TaxID=210409 RepID=UPI001E1CDF85|nr:uncharacterized protein LOC123504634 [Portunus trituberculatus]XP_045111281.1 uncharacterized protein LOC123504634 [Portunus trituberculatus]XP_045111282.1 uncharacterized protein LOC123504634 [Portunus trituberculatus]